MSVTATDFNDALDAYRFIVSWNGRSVYELKEAINYVRFEGAGTIQTSLSDLMNDVCRKLEVNPAADDRSSGSSVPDHLQQKPLWAVDSQGRALVGIPGHERVIEYFDSAEYMNS